MIMPEDQTLLTQLQVDAALNLSAYTGAKPKPGSKWHRGVASGGVMEIWSGAFGYKDMFPMYAHVLVGGKDYHIYYLNDRNAAPIIMKLGEAPQKYGVSPKPAAPKPPAATAPAATAPAPDPAATTPAGGRPAWASASAFVPRGAAASAHARALPVTRSMNPEAPEFKFPGT